MSIAQIAPREGYAKSLIEIAKTNDKIVVLDGDCAKSNLTNLFGAEYPDRFFNMGIAEQDIVGTAAGLALGGKIPFANAYANFLTGRAWDQMRISVCYSNLNVKIVGHNAGTSAAQEGATHLPFEDIALMRALPRMTVIVPCDSVEMEKAVKAAAEFEGPVYLRVGKLPAPVVTNEQDPFAIGKARILREGQDVTIISTGILLYEALQAADQLQADGISAEVIHCATIKPLDLDTIAASAAKTKRVVTVEEHSIVGGLTGAVAEGLTRVQPTLMRSVGNLDRFGFSGKMDELLDLLGMRAVNVIQAVHEIVEQPVRNESCQ
ncbi:transketolase family protein [Fodinisporobacter ferrooxydans]|uniref:Transketolase family protein n=1 Tax=Fodinisporobacter ferrooxydans TaxID=2901836 RepID=A0ABY4CIC6_9BACL|nr:transketolase family protein [Alicyclobacillaceae bacterium MYW30-H2]